MVGDDQDLTARLAVVGSVYALVAEVSVGKLFVAGYVPGILVGLALMIVAGAIAKAKRYPTTERVPFARAVGRFISAAPSLGLVIVVIGGIVGGDPPLGEAHVDEDAAAWGGHEEAVSAASAAEDDGPACQLRGLPSAPPGSS